jgi:hypothetical protein
MDAEALKGPGLISATLHELISDLKSKNSEDILSGDRRLVTPAPEPPSYRKPGGLSAWDAPRAVAG